QILYAQHNIVFLVAVCVFRYIVEIPQIPLCSLQLDDPDGRTGGCPQEPVLLIRTPRRQAGHVGAMSVLVPAWHDGKRVLCSQGPVYILSRILAPVEKAG